MVLLAGLVAAFLGSGVIGWLDPLSLLVRSFGLSLLPAFNAGVRELLAPMEQSHIAMIRTLGEGLHKALQAVLLDLRQPHFAQGVFLGVLFLAILFASLRITRFWCRAICPLGALLGVVSWWSIFGLHKKAPELRQLQPVPASLPGRRQPDWRRAVAQERAPVDADSRSPHRLLRAKLHALLRGLSDGGHQACTYQAGGREFVKSLIFPNFRNSNAARSVCIPTFRFGRHGTRWRGRGATAFAS